MRSRLLVVAVSLGVLLGLAHLALREISTAPLRTRIEERLTQVLGRAVSLDDLDVALLPTPHLSAAGVRVAALPGRSSADLLHIDRVALGIAFWPLLRRTVAIDSLAIDDADLHLETDDEGRLVEGLHLTLPTAEGAGGGFAFELHALQVDRLRVFYRDARDGRTYSLVLDSVSVESEDLDHEILLAANGRFEGSEIELSGRIGSFRELMTPTRPFPVDLAGRLFEARFQATGTVRELATIEGLDLAITAEIPELVVKGRSLPQLGRIRFAGRLSDLDGSLGLDQLSMDLTKSDLVRLDVHGGIGDLFHLADVDVEARVETGSLDFLAPLLAPLLQKRLGLAWPAIASLKAQTRLSDRSGRLRLDGSVRAATPGDAIVIHAEGGATDLARTPRLDVKLDARADDLASVTALVPDAPKAEGLGPVTASGRLRSLDSSLGADDIVVHLGSREKVWAEVDGSIADIASLRGVALELSFGAVSLHHLKALLARELPHTSPFEGSAGISDADGSLGVEHLRLHGGGNSPVEVHLEARFDDLPRRDEIEVALGLRGQDLRVLGAIAGLDLPAVGPVELHGKIQGSDERLAADDVALRLGETRLTGSLSGSFAPDARPAVTARLASKDVRLQDLGLRPAEKPSAESTGPAAPWLQDGTATLPFAQLRRVDLDLGFQLDRVGGYQDFDARDVHFLMRLQDGDLVVEDAGARYQSGDLDFDLRADARTPVPALRMGLRAKGVDIARIASQFRKHAEASGILDAELDLRARGDTLDALRRSLTGRLGLALRDGDLVSRIAREFVLDLATAVFPGLRAKNVSSIGCGIAHLEIENGLVTVHTLFLKEKDLSVVGTGEVDLVRGLYDLRVVPRTTHPGIVSVAPEVEVTGPLDDPSFHPVKRTLLTSFGRGIMQNVFNAGALLVRPLMPKQEARAEDECRAPSLAAP